MTLETEKKYCYFFTRQDISKEQQLVQTAHVSYKLGSALGNFADPNNMYFTCIGVRNLPALEAVESILDTFNFEYESFIEPDLNNGEMTALAVYPVSESKKGVLLAFNLLRMQ